LISPQRAGQLKAFLGSLPEQIAARLARAVEVDRLGDGKSLPHELILQSLRPSLRRLGGSERTPTALRFFCLPFEDLFCVSSHRVRKQKGRIARGSVAPIWNWVGRTLLPQETKIYCRNFKAALVAANHSDTKALAEGFWPLAGAAMRAALAEQGGRAAARAQLGGDLIVADAEEAALLLGVGGAVIKIQELLAKPVGMLDDKLLASLRAIHDALVESTPDAAPYVAVIAMNRLSQPWEAVKLPLSRLPASHGLSISVDDMGLAGEIMFGDIESCAAVARAATQPVFDVDVLSEAISCFTTLASGPLKDFGMRGDGKWDTYLRNEQAALAEIMTAFLARAPKELSRALPRQGRAATEESVERALRYARLVVACRPFAVAGAFGPSHKKGEQEMIEMLHSHNAEVVTELRGAGAARRVLIENQFEVNLKLSAALFGDANAASLRRRGRVAQRSKRAA